MGKMQTTKADVADDPVTWVTNLITVNRESAFTTEQKRAIDEALCKLRADLRDKG